MNGRDFKSTSYIVFDSLYYVYITAEDLWQCESNRGLWLNRTCSVGILDGSEAIEWTLGLKSSSEPTGRIF